MGLVHRQAPLGRAIRPAAGELDHFRHFGFEFRLPSIDLFQIVGGKLPICVPAEDEGPVDVQHLRRILPAHVIVRATENDGGADCGDDRDAVIMDDLGVAILDRPGQRPRRQRVFEIVEE